MEKALSLTDIKARFASEWVLIQDPKTTRAMELIQGVVVGHSKDRDALYRTARGLHLQRAAIIYTGEVPQDTAVVL